MLWCLLGIWSFLSQVLFATYLILQLTKSEEEDTLFLSVLVIMTCSALLLSYLCNLLYLIHYLQIWNDVSAPGIVRAWLELWSWILIAITMTVGGVYVALELCNSIIISNIKSIFKTFDGTLPISLRLQQKPLTLLFANSVWS